MAIGIRTRLVMGMMAAAVVLVSPRAWGQPATTAPASQPSQPAMQTLEQLTAVLNGPQSRQEERDEAARRLLARRTPEARKIVIDALIIGTQQPAQLAAIKALAEDPQPEPQLVPALASMLERSPPMAIAAIRALVNYRDLEDVYRALAGRISNRGADATVRREMIRALGSFVEKRAADVLVEIIDPARSPNETAVNREAAMDALAELTGLPENGRDPGRWLQWWESNRNRPDAEFRSEMLNRRSARLDQVRQELSDAYQALGLVLRDSYRSAAERGPAQRIQKLLEFLRSSRVEVRVIGASLVLEDFRNTIPIPPEVRFQLRQMVGDSSTRVRRGVAQVLGQINDTDAFDALLEQLTIEPDGLVRLELVTAIKPMRNVRAVPQLLRLLDDRNTSIAMAAADALDSVGQNLREQDPPLATQTALKLRAKLHATAPTAANLDFREQLVKAMVPLRQAILLQDPLIRILQQQANEPVDMRWLAIKAIGEIGLPESRTIILSNVQDPEQRIRQEALVALGKLEPSAENIHVLRGRIDPANERDESVRSEAWAVLEGMFPHLTTEQLQELADSEPFKRDPARKIAVLKALETKLEQETPVRTAELADVQWNIGTVLLGDPNSSAELDPKAAADAAPFLERALQNKRALANAPAVTIDDIIRDLMRALLRSVQYEKAVTLAANSIRADSRYHPLMGSSIRAEAEYLRSGGKVDEALKLIEQTKQMNPKLDDQYLDWLAEFERWANSAKEIRGLTPDLTPLPVPPSQDAIRPATRPNRTASITS